MFFFLYYSVKLMNRNGTNLLNSIGNNRQIETVTIFHEECNIFLITSCFQYSHYPSHYFIEWLGSEVLTR